MENKRIGAIDDFVQQIEKNLGKIKLELVQYEKQKTTNTKLYKSVMDELIVYERMLKVLGTLEKKLR